MWGSGPTAPTAEMANVHVAVSNDGVGNTYTDTLKQTWFKNVSNKGAFKVNVMGDVGDNVQNYLLNLNDIQAVQLPNGQFAFLI